jgi:hypothetical protein
LKYLRSLDHKHYAAIRLRLEGANNATICDELRIQRDTLYRWWSDDLVKAELQRQAEHIDEVFAEKLASAGFKALEKMLEVAVDADRPTDPDGIPQPMSDDQRLKYLTEIMDRLPALSRVRERAGQATGGPVVPGMGGDINTVVNMFQEMDERTLLAFLQGGFRQIGPGQQNGNGAAGPDIPNG